MTRIALSIILLILATTVPAPAGGRGCYCADRATGKVVCKIGKPSPAQRALLCLVR